MYIPSPECTLKFYWLIKCGHPGIAHTQSDLPRTEEKLQVGSGLSSLRTVPLATLLPNHLESDLMIILESDFAGVYKPASEHSVWPAACSEPGEDQGLSIALPTSSSCPLPPVAQKGTSPSFPFLLQAVLSKRLTCRREDQN